MIIGTHTVLFTPEAEKLRSFFRDTLGLGSVDAGGGWLIFALPPAEMGIHPSGGSMGHEMHLLCDDLERTMTELGTRGVTFTGSVGEEEWGRTIRIALPDGGELGLYQPRHPLAHGGGGAEPIDFTVTTPKDQVFTLSRARGRVVALHFLLKTACPFCEKLTREYARRESEIPGLVNVFLKPDTEEEILAWTAGLEGAPPVYRDPDAGLAARMGIPGGYAFHGQVVHYPALVLIGLDGRERFRHVGAGNKDRLPFDELKRRVTGLS